VARWLWAIILLGILGGGVVWQMTRGLRNNNPGNIRKSGDRWKGLAPDQPDPDFFTFVNPVFGIRAIAKILMNYQDKHHLTTIRQVINRWAPASENDTESYVNSVASQMGVDPDMHLDIYDALPRLVPAIIKHENGIQPYDVATIGRGIEMAVNG